MSYEPEYMEKLEIMKARQQEREDQKKAKKALEASEKSDESTDRFLEQFNAEKKGITLELESLSAKAEEGKEVLDSALANILTKIEFMRRLRAEASHYLPSWEQQQSQKALNALQKDYEEYKEKHAPKQKFSFKARRAKKAAEKKAKAEAAAKAKAEAVAFAGDKKEGELAKEAPQPAEKAESVDDILARAIGNKPVVTISKKASETIYYPPESIKGTDVFISGMTDCTVSISDVMGACRMNDLTKCTILLGPIQGSVHIQNAKDCTLVFSSRQVRLHDAFNCDFYIACMSGPIIEDCSGLRFAPYNLEYEGLSEQMNLAGLGTARENDKWSQTNDFKWLRQQQSPNWSILSEAERLSTRSPVLQTATPAN